MRFSLVHPKIYNAIGIITCLGFLATLGSCAITGGHEMPIFGAVTGIVFGIGSLLLIILDA